MLSWLSYFAFRAVETAARILPLGVAWRVGGGLGWLALWFMPGYRKLLIRNLTIAFGREMSPEEIRKLSRKHMVYVGGNLLSGMKMPFLTPEAVLNRLEIEGLDQVKTALQKGRGAVYVVLHMGNWEILSQTKIVAGGSPSAALFQPLHNAPLNAHVMRERERIGCRMFNRQDGYQEPVSWVRNNGVLGILADQRAGDTGVWCPFFGKLASTTILPALIAKRAGSPMFPVAVLTTGPGRWKMVIGHEIPGVSRDESPEMVTVRMNERLEELVRLSPVDWFWLHNRWKPLKTEFLLTNSKRGIALSPSRGVKDLQPFEMVVRAPDSLSDSCHALPAVRSLRRGRPDARVTVLTRESLADFWRMDPEVDEVVAVPDNAGVPAAAEALKRTGRLYDAGILFSDTKDAARELVKAGIPRVTGYEGEGRKRLLDQVIQGRRKPAPVAHRTRDFLRIALRVGADVEDATLLDPLPSSETPAPAEGLVIALCPGGDGGEAARWPAERWAEAANLVTDAGVPVTWVILGSPAEAALGAQIAGLLKGGVKDLTGKTTLTELAHELRQCTAVVAHDSGPLHLAALLGVATVGIFGPTEPVQTAPQNPRHITVRRHVECGPCFLRTCPMDHRCMLEIPAARVAEAILKSLPASVGA